jgi:hypothetical protein
MLLSSEEGQRRCPNHNMQTSLSLPTAQSGAIDSLIWKATLDFAGLWGTDAQQIVIQDWQGDIAFYHRADLSGGGMISVPATLVGANDHVRYSVGRAPLTFKTCLPGDAFERIERFRNAGSLVARLEGQLKILCLGPMQSLDNARVQALLRGWSPGGSNGFVNVDCEPREIRDQWIEHVLPTFGKPNRVLIEATLPKLAPSNEAGVRTVVHLQEADVDFTHGRYKGAAHAAFRALEALEDQELLDGVEAVYGKLVRNQVSKQISALHGVTHKGRHDASQEPTPPIEFDRSLAMHILTATKSIAGVVFACDQPPPRERE